jgi:hypothetical protein
MINSVHYILGLLDSAKAQAMRQLSLRLSQRIGRKCKCNTSNARVPDYFDSSHDFRPAFFVCKNV